MRCICVGGLLARSLARSLALPLSRAASTGRWTGMKKSGDGPLTQQGKSCAGTEEEYPNKGRGTLMGKSYVMYPTRPEHIHGLQIHDGILSVVYSSA